MMDQKAGKVDRYCELPLLLKDEDIQRLRRKFEKDDQFLKECKKFMEELIDQVAKIGMFHIRLF